MVPLLALGAVIEVREVEDVFPGSSTQIVGLLSRALSHASGCVFETRTCGADACRDEASSDAQSPRLRLYVIGGVQLISITLEGAPARSPIEAYWPIESEGWPNQAEALARLAFPAPVCSTVGQEEPKLQPHDSPVIRILPAVFAVLAAGALGTGVTTAVLAGESSTEAKAAPVWTPKVGELWEDADMMSSVSHISFGAAIGLAGLAVVTELWSD